MGNAAIQKYEKLWWLRSKLCYATKSYFVISILSRDWFLSDTSNLGTLSPFTNAFFFWILTARGYARGRGYAPSITSDRTSAWHATFGEESGKSVARWSSLWVDICVARCVKQCQIRRNQSKRSLIDYLTMLSGSKAAFRTNYLHERSFTLREVLKKIKMEI